MRTNALAVVLFMALSLGAANAHAESVRVEADLDHAVLQAKAKQTAYLRLALTGMVPAGETHRAPMNVAIVIDRSGSMTGRKIEQAKAAAIAAIDRMRPDDIVSVVAYDSTVSVLVPATKVADRSEVVRGIRRLRAGGNTALFAGTVKGAAEVRKFLAPGRVNRVILLSDGRANVGPDSPAELSQLGRSLREEGIGVTTVGLGLDYNEDLMAGLARSSGATFTYVENAADLTKLYELGFAGLSRVVASEIVARVEFAEGFRPVRVLGRDAEIVGQRVTVPIAHLYGEAADEILVEFETPRVEAAEREVAEIDVSYHWIPTESAERVKAAVSAHFSASRRQVDESANPKVKIAVAQRLADARTKKAIRMRDEGRMEDAERELRDAAGYLSAQAERFDSETLRKQSEEVREDSRSVRGSEWKARRKRIKRATMRPAMDEAF